MFIYLVKLYRNSESQSINNLNSCVYVYSLFVMFEFFVHFKSRAALVHQILPVVHVVPVGTANFPLGINK